MIDALVIGCKALAENSGSLALGLFLFGVVGGISHCTVQCGAFVAALLPSKGAAPSIAPLARSSQGLYHLGRVTTYALIAALVSATGHLLSGAEAIGEWAALAFVLAGLAFLASAFGAQLPAAWNRLVHKGALLGGRGGLFPLGMVMGLVPCAMSGVAIFMAAGAAEPLGAFGAAFAFGLGTAVALIPFSVLLERLGRVLSLPRWIIPALRGGAGMILFTFAISIMTKGS